MEEAVAGIHSRKIGEAMTVATMLVLLLAVATTMWMFTPARPQAVKARRNALQEDLLAAYANQRADR